MKNKFLLLGAGIAAYYLLCKNTPVSGMGTFGVEDGTEIDYYYGLLNKFIDHYELFADWWETKNAEIDRLLKQCSDKHNKVLARDARVLMQRVSHELQKLRDPRRKKSRDTVSHSLLRNISIKISNMAIHCENITPKPDQICKRECVRLPQQPYKCWWVVRCPTV